MTRLMFVLCLFCLGCDEQKVEKGTRFKTVHHATSARDIFEIKDLQEGTCYMRIEDGEYFIPITCTKDVLESE